MAGDEVPLLLLIMTMITSQLLYDEALAIGTGRIDNLYIESTAL